MMMMMYTGSCGIPSPKKSPHPSSVLGWTPVRKEGLRKIQHKQRRGGKPAPHLENSLEPHAVYGINI